ncbi:MAG: hypothetical protein JKY14_06035, partial [Paraglaciecola sp.]|nr:hypothetical protein [Paraglaciecola sp.]
MNRIKFYSLILLGFLVVTTVGGILWINQATSTHHEFKLSELGHKSSQKTLLSSLALGQKVSLHTISSADWEASLSGLINLEHPDAK